MQIGRSVIFVCLSAPVFFKRLIYNLVKILCNIGFNGWRVPFLRETVFVKKSHLVRPSAGFLNKFIVGPGTFSTETDQKHVCNLGGTKAFSQAESENSQYPDVSVNSVMKHVC